MKYLILFGIGVMELFLSVTDFKLTQKNRKMLSSITTFIGIILWYLVILTIIEYINNIKLAIIYALGCSVGCYIGLSCEPLIEKYFRLQPRGRKRKRGKTKRKRKS